MRRRGTEMGSEDKLNWGHLPNLFRRARLEGEILFSAICVGKGGKREREGAFFAGERKGELWSALSVLKGEQRQGLKLALIPGENDLSL